MEPQHMHTASKRRKIVVRILVAVAIVVVCRDAVFYLPNTFSPRFLAEDVFMLDANEAWVVGRVEHYLVYSPRSTAFSHASAAQFLADPGQVSDTFHLHNGVWSEVNVASYGLDKVVELKSNDAWALGDVDGMFHFDGQAWVHDADSASMSAQDFAMSGPNDGWAVGRNDLWHCTGGRWVNATALAVNAETVPNDGSGLGLTAVSMDSATDGWAVGWNGRVRHFDGTEWKLVNVSASLSDQEVDFTSVHMDSADEGWMVGNEDSLSPTGGSVILHCRDGTWSPALSQAGQ